MLEKLAHLVTRKPKIVVAIALALLIPSALGYVATRVNFDVLSYIPQELDSVKGEELLEDPFSMAATAQLIVEDMPADYVAQLQNAIEEIDGVSKVLSSAGTLGSQLPQSMIPQELTDMFYAKNNPNSTQMMIFFDNPAASDETMEAIGQIRQVTSEKCFLAGFSIMITDMKETVDGEMPQYILLAVMLAIAAMTVMMESWVLPLAIIFNIGLAILYNLGSNILFGEISFVTQALAAILQLGVTMDYSVFLYSRYREELQNYADKRDAMATAIQAAFVSLSGSSLTTIAGFASLLVMQITLGGDVGKVMMKGVMLGILCVVLVLPSIILVLDRPIQKYRHKAFDPDTTKLNRFLVKHRWVFLVIALLAYFPAVYSQANAETYHDLVGNMLPDTSPSVVATEKLKDDYGIVNQHFTLVHTGTMTSAEVNDFVDALEAVPGVDSVLTFRSYVPDSVPDFFIPDDIMEMFQQGGWTYVMINSSLETATDEMEDQINTIYDSMKKYDPHGYLTGSATMAKDLYETADVDFARVNYLSIIAILILVAIVFRSATVPVILVACIELAIFINEGVPYWTGETVPFIANTFIGCIQLGATVDYSILLATRYREELQAGHDRKEAMVIAATSSDHSIIAGALVLFCACLSVAVISHIDLVACLCKMLSQGTLVSAIICLFFVPPILVICEPLIARTTLGWRKPYVSRRQKKAHAAQMAAADAPSPDEVFAQVIPDSDAVLQEEAQPASQPVSQNGKEPVTESEPVPPAEDIPQPEGASDPVPELAGVAAGPEPGPKSQPEAPIER